MITTMMRTTLHQLPSLWLRRQHPSDTKIPLLLSLGRQRDRSLLPSDLVWNVLCAFAFSLGLDDTQILRVLLGWNRHGTGSADIILLE